MNALEVLWQHKDRRPCVLQWMLLMRKPGDHGSKVTIKVEIKWQNHETAPSFNFKKCICMSICLYLCLHTTWAQCPHWLKEGIGSPDAGVTGGYELPRRCWQSKPGPLEEKPMLSNGEVSFQLQSMFVRTILQIHIKEYIIILYQLYFSKER